MITLRPNCICWQGGHFEEAQLLREREIDLKRDLGGPAQIATTRFPRVSAAEVEAVISPWSGVPIEQMSSDEAIRLRQLQDSLKVCGASLQLVLQAYSVVLPGGAELGTYSHQYAILLWLCFSSLIL